MALGQLRLTKVVCCLLVALTLCLSGCECNRVEYLSDSERVYPVRAGEPSPIDGYVLSEGYLVRLYEALKTTER